MSFMVTDLGLLLRVAILEAIIIAENSCMASFLHALYFQPLQECTPIPAHNTFSSCFIASVASVAVAVTLASNKVCGLNQVCCPAPIAVGNQYISWVGLAVAGGKFVANLPALQCVGSATHSHNAVTKSVVPGDHNSSMFTCDRMMAENVKCTSRAQGTLRTP